MTAPRLDDLDSEERALVLAMLRAEAAKKNATTAQPGPDRSPGSGDAPDPKTDPGAFLVWVGGQS